MSILLESLVKENPVNDQGVPELSANHFYDEDDSDQKLLEQVKKWRLISISLSLVLAASWIYFVVAFSATNNSQNNLVGESVEETIKQTVKRLMQENQQQFNQQQFNHSVAGSQLVPASSVPSSTDERWVAPAQLSTPLVEHHSERKQYVPRKRANTQPQSNQTQIVTSPVTSSVSNPAIPVERQVTTGYSNTSMLPLVPVVNVLGANGPDTIIALGSLPQLQREQFPKVTINSYVVADKAEDSFVISNSQFYSVNQVMDNGLVLREINNDDIVVEFQSQWVRILYH